MRKFKLLAMMAVVTVAVSACSSTDDDMYLGSRDDIVVNNNGMTKTAAETAVKAKIETAKMDAETKAMSEAQEMAATETAAVEEGVEAAKTAVMETAETMKTEEMASSVAPAAAPATATAASMPTGAAGDIPPNARPGECYAKVLIPAVTQTRTERVQVSEEQKVLNRIIPARYDVQTERVLVKEARQYWKAGHGPVTQVNQVTGEIMCLVEEPAQYKTIEKRVLIEPEKPEYKMVPARFETVSKTDVVQAESWEWRRILCETNMGQNSIIRIQQALRSKGYNIVIDGRLGNETMNALNAYQRKNGLATRGITYETLGHLGVELVGA